MPTQLRPLNNDDISLVVDYFLKADQAFLRYMGVDSQKLPDRATWQKIIANDLLKPLRERQFYYLIWLQDGLPIGHTNVNKIHWGGQAYMHSHIWFPGQRNKGQGRAMLQQALPAYFKHFELSVLYCEPHAENVAVNKTLPKLGFEYVKMYETTPGWINFEQKVNRWRLTRERFMAFKF